MRRYAYQRAAKDLEKGMPLAVAALEEWHAETFKHAGKLKAPHSSSLRPHTPV
jgi:hypothetical protein